MKFNFNFVLTSILFLLLSSEIPAGAVSETTGTGSCPEQWATVVKQIDQWRHKNSSSPVPGVLFVGNDGRVFNCLSEAIRPDALARIEGYEKSKAGLLSHPDAENELPLNFCNVGKLIDLNSDFYFIYLPYSELELTSALCRKILESSLEFASGM